MAYIVYTFCTGRTQHIHSVKGLPSLHSCVYYAHTPILALVCIACTYLYLPSHTSHAYTYTCVRIHRMHIPTLAFEPRRTCLHPAPVLAPTTVCALGTPNPLLTKPGLPTPTKLGLSSPCSSSPSSLLTSKGAAALGHAMMYLPIRERQRE